MLKIWNGVPNPITATMADITLEWLKPFMKQHTKEGVVQLTMDGVFVKQYVSIEDAAQSTRINRTSISMCCRNLHTHGGDYRGMYLSDYESLINQDVKELSADA